jgi:hypothetical protein
MSQAVGGPRGLTRYAVLVDGVSKSLTNKEHPGFDGSLAAWI